MKGTLHLAAKEQPDWVCRICGDMWGRKLPDMATWHHGQCGVCRNNLQVTEPRDFGFLNKGWNSDTMQH